MRQKRRQEGGRVEGDGKESEGVCEFLPLSVLMSPRGTRSQTSLTEFLVRSLLPTQASGGTQPAHALPRHEARQHGGTGARRRRKRGWGQ